MSNSQEAKCCAVNCENAGRFVCKRCKIERYCSTSCQKATWPVHKAHCSGKVEKTYEFDYSFDRTATEKEWRRSDMQNGPEQPMDPPEEYDFYWPWWNDRELKLGGKIVARSSFCPPALKDLLRKGLREKTITWEYLFSDNFMHIVTYAWVPLQYVLEMIEDRVFPAEVKPSPQGLTELAVEHFWRVRALPGQLDYNPEVAGMLKRYGVTLPFTDSHCYEDEFRLYTHRMTRYSGYPPCSCWGCQVRPFKQAREREAWEALRTKAAKKGLFMMSWTAKLEYEQQQQQQQEGDQGGKAGGGGEGQAASTAQQPGNDGAQNWRHEGDDKAEIRTNLSRKELAEVVQLVDAIYKQQRLPLSEEMDYIMGKVSVTKDAYLQQTRREVESAVSAARSSEKAPTTPTLESKSNAATTGGQKLSVSDGGDGNAVAEKLAGVSIHGPTIAAARPRRSAASKTVSYAEEDGSSQESHISQKGARQVAGEGCVVNSSSDSEAWSDSEDEDSDSEESDLVPEGDESSGSASGGVVAVADDGGGRRGGAKGVTRGSGKGSAGPKKTAATKEDRFRWNDDMDARLKEGVERYKAQGWQRVAEHVGGGVTSKQCKNRWVGNLHPVVEGRKKGGWTDEEVGRLMELAQQHVVEPYWSDRFQKMTERHIDWTAIGQELGRAPLDCKDKHRCMLASKMKKGPFTPEEDAVIVLRVREWGDRGKGLGPQLEQELGRPAVAILKRWRKTLSKKQS